MSARKFQETVKAWREERGIERPMFDEKLEPNTGTSEVIEKAASL